MADALLVASFFIRGVADGLLDIRGTSDTD